MVGRRREQARERVLKQFSEASCLCYVMLCYVTHMAFSGNKLLKLGKPPPGSVLSLISLWTVLIHVVIITINASCARTARINTCALPLGSNPGLARQSLHLLPPRPGLGQSTSLSPWRTSGGCSAGPVIRFPSRCAAAAARCAGMMSTPPQRACCARCCAASTYPDLRLKPRTSRLARTLQLTLVQYVDARARPG